MELKKYNGCGNCELCKQEVNCKDIHVPVNITFKKAEKADDWGRVVTVFKAGEAVQGEAVIKDNKVYCASARSNIYEGYEDFINTENADIELIK